MSTDEVMDILVGAFDKVWQPLVETRHAERLERDEAANIIRAVFDVPAIAKKTDEDLRGRSQDKRVVLIRYHKRMLQFYVEYFVNEILITMDDRQVKKPDVNLVKDVKNRLKGTVGAELCPIFPC